MATPILIDQPNGSVRAITIRNLFNLTHQTGMRITDDGFFQITNRIGAGTEARLDSGGNWTKASDRRLKQDIEGVSGLLDKVLSMEPVEYYYVSQDLEEMPHKSVGLIAQDVEQVLPQLVSGSAEGNKYLDYTGLVPVLIGAVKELNQRYDERLAALESQIADLRRQ